MIQMASGIGDLLLLAGLAAVLVLAAWAGVLRLRRRSPAKPLRGLAAVVGGYALMLVLGGILSREHRVPLGTTSCFDDWCAAVTAVHAVPGPGPSQQLVIADLRVSSVAKRVAQRGSDPQVYFIDTGGTWYRADRTVDAHRDVRSRIGPGESFRTALAGIVPVGRSVSAVRLWEGAWIDRVIPFDEESPFHQKTYYVVSGW